MLSRRESCLKAQKKYDSRYERGICDNRSGVRTDDYVNKTSQGYNIMPLTQTSITQEKQNCK